MLRRSLGLIERRAPVGAGRRRLGAWLFASVVWQLSPLGLLVIGLVLLSQLPALPFSAMVPYQAHVFSSADRFLAHVAPTVVFWLARSWLEARLLSPSAWIAKLVVGVAEPQAWRFAGSG